MAQEWNIRSRGNICSASGRAFDDGAVVYSRLAFREEGYVREDYGAEEWNESLRDEAVSVWKGVYHAPPPAPPEPLKKETAESLLRQLMETDEEGNRNVIFILAVMLERRRLLVERDVISEDDGRRIRVYEHRGTGETFIVPDPQLRLAELEDVQREVLERLGGSLGPVPNRSGEGIPEGKEPVAGDDPS